MVKFSIGLAVTSTIANLLHWYFSYPIIEAAMR